MQKRGLNMKPKQYRGEEDPYKKMTIGQWLDCSLCWPLHEQKEIVPINLRVLVTMASTSLRFSKPIEALRKEERDVVSSFSRM